MSLIPEKNVTRSTRERILFAAASCFCANGFKNSTIREIALNAGLNEGTIFRYFPQKQDLYWPAIDWYCRNSGLADVFRERLCQNGSPKAVLAQFSKELERTIEHNPGLVRLVCFTALELETETRSLCEVHLRPLCNAFLTRIKLWMEAGELPIMDAGLLATTIAVGIAPDAPLRAMFEANPFRSSQIIDFVLSRETQAPTLANCTPEESSSL